MKLLLDVKDERAKFVIGLLQKLPYVKVIRLSRFHYRILDEANDILEDVHLIEQGKLETRDAEEFLNELLCKNDAKV